MDYEKAIKRLQEMQEDVQHKISALPPLMRDRTSLNSTVQTLGMALEALREKAEREDPRPLTLEELSDMEDVPFYVQMVDVIDDTKWSPIYFPAIYDTVCDVEVAVWTGDESSHLKFSDYGKTWIAYRHKPKGVWE